MINGVSSNTYLSQVLYSNKKRTEIQNIDQSVTNGSGVILDIGNCEIKNDIYQKPSSKMSAEEVNRLWEQSQKATESLRTLVEKLIEKQGKRFGNVLSGKEGLMVDAETRAEAEKMISEDGDWGVNAVSSRIVDFAKAISGGDQSKFDELKSAIEEGFKQAKQALGGSLPDICQKTYEETMKKLDEWGNADAQKSA